MAKNFSDKTKRFKMFEDELLFFEKDRVGLDAQRESSIKGASKHFENQEMLEQGLNLGALTYECEFIAHKISESWVGDTVSSLIEEFRFARDRDPAAFFSLWTQWLDQYHSRATNNTAGIAELQNEKLDLAPPLLVRSMFRDIGELLEGTLQRFSKLRLEIWNYLEWRAHPQKKVNELDFGQVIGELNGSTRSLGVYKHTGLPISQWRNIANHNNYELNNNQVICQYGKGHGVKKLAITIDNLSDIYRYCNDLTQAHKVAIEFFSADNMTELAKNPPKYRTSDFSLDAAFAYGLVASGFSIKHADCDCSKNWRLTLLDNKKRSSVDVNTALQEACYPMVLHRGSIHVVACVLSGVEVYTFSFLVSTKRHDESISPDFCGEIRRTADNFRLLPADLLERKK